MKVRASIFMTGLSVDQIRRVLGGTLGRAVISELPPNSLEEAAAIRVLVEHRPSLFSGLGAVELRVRDLGSSRHVEISARGTTVAEGTVQGFARDMSDYRPIGASKKLATQIIDSLSKLDPNLQQT